MRGVSFIDVALQYNFGIVNRVRRIGLGLRSWICNRALGATLIRFDFVIGNNEFDNEVRCVWFLRGDYMVVGLV